MSFTLLKKYTNFEITSLEATLGYDRNDDNGMALYLKKIDIICVQ